MEHGLKDIASYAQKPITPYTVVITSLLVHDKPLGVPASVKRVYWSIRTSPVYRCAMTTILNTHFRIRGVSTKTGITITYCYNSTHLLSRAIAYWLISNELSRALHPALARNVYTFIYNKKHIDWYIQVKITKVRVVNTIYRLWVWNKKARKLIHSKLIGTN